MREQSLSDLFFLFVLTSFWTWGLRILPDNMSFGEDSATLGTSAEAAVQATTDANFHLRSICVILFLFLAVFVGSSFTPTLQDDADSTHAEAAREMYSTGDYVTLHVNGVRYLEKAPMMYWLVAMTYHLLGVNEFATRVPTLLAMLGLILLGMRWARRAFDVKCSVYFGLFACTATGYFLFTRILIPEAVLSFFIGLALFFFLTGMEFPQHSWRIYAAYSCMALAVLTKGLLAIVSIAGPIVLYLVITGQWRRWRQLRLPSGLSLFVAIAAPWHLLAGFRNPNFFWFYFVNEHFLRFIGKRYPVDYNKLPAGLYWLLHFVWLFPWSIYLPLAVRRMWHLFKERGSADFNFARQSEILCCLWAAVILTFFALSTNQEYYTFPAYLPLLLLLANALKGEEQLGRTRWLTGCTVALTVFALAVSIALAVGLWTSRLLPYQADLGSLLARPNLSADTLSMGHILDLTGPSFAALRLPAVLAMLAFAMGPGIALFLRLGRQNYPATVITAVTMAIFLVAAHIALTRFETYLGSHNLAMIIKAEVKPEDRVMIYGDQAFGSSLLFYLKRPIDLVNGRTTSMWFGSTYSDAPHIFWTDNDLQRDWKSDLRVFLFVPQHQRERVDQLLPQQKWVIAESSGKVIYANRR